MKLLKSFPLFIIALFFIMAIYFYPQLPSTLITHWGPQGEPNGYSSKDFGLFFMPVLSIVLYLIFRYLPHTDPYKKNFHQFESYFNKFIVIVFIFLFYVYLITLAINLGANINIIQFLIPGFVLIFYYTGVLLSVAKRNWFVGIRTPWTLSSDQVWDKTHLLGARLFKFAAIFSLLGFLLPLYAIWFVLIPVLGVSLFLFVYSYILYKQP